MQTCDLHEGDVVRYVALEGRRWEVDVLVLHRSHDTTECVVVRCLSEEAAFPVGNKLVLCATGSSARHRFVLSPEDWPDEACVQIAKMKLLKGED
jgi:hypothetical protein